MNEHTLRYKCKECGHLEDEKYNYIDCCISCGNKDGSLYGIEKIYTEEVGYWQDRATTKKKTYNFWIFKFEVDVAVIDRIWIKKEVV